MKPMTKTASRSTASRKQTRRITPITAVLPVPVLLTGAAAGSAVRLLPGPAERVAGPLVLLVLLAAVAAVTRSIGARATQPAAAKAAELRTFDDAMRTGIRKSTRIAPFAAAIPLLTLLIGAGAGGVLRLLPAPADTVVPTGLAVLLVTGALAGLRGSVRKPPLPRVDWSTADTYGQHLTAALSPVTRAVLTTARAKVLDRCPAATRVHLYVMGAEPGHAQSCTVDSGGCRCAPLRWSAALLPHPRSPILTIGERLLDHPRLLDFALTHEAAHARCASRTLHILMAAPLTVTALALGLMISPHHLPVALPVLWLLPAALRWLDELRADTTAVRTVGPATAIEYWTKVRSAHPHPTGISRAKTIARALITPHPPIAVRVAAAKRVKHPSD